MARIDSTALSFVSWSDRRLTVVFRESGRRYTYEGVPRSLYDDLLQAPSAGQFFNETIRDRFPFRLE